MGEGIVRIANHLIAQVLNFESGWVIEKIMPTTREGESEMLILGSAFPDVNNRGDAENVELICHKERISWEVKKRRK